MSQKFTIYDLRFTIERSAGSARFDAIGQRAHRDTVLKVRSSAFRRSGAEEGNRLKAELQTRACGQPRGFSLVEVLVVVSLLSLIVLALMTVFNSTQSAFRSGVTQTDVLEGGRAAMDLMVSDVKLMTPSDNQSNTAVNFFTTNNLYAYTPLVQALPGSNAQRTNLLNYFFVLGRQNTMWTGVGYIVNTANTTSTGPLYPLYRFYAQTNIQNNPETLFNDFFYAVLGAQWTNMSHVIDGVVDLRVHAFDVNGYQMTNTYPYEAGQYATNQNVQFFPSQWGETGFYFFSNAVPASVEVQMSVLEDRPLARAESLAGTGPGLSLGQSNYLAQEAGQVHVFRQRVTIPNVDPTAYQ